MDKREDLLYNCCRLYYREHLQKKEIAQLINVSPTHVTRLLREAEEKGIVHITVSIVGNHEKLERDLRNKFNLKYAAVSNSSEDYEQLKGFLGSRCASFFEELLEKKNTSKVGIGGGGSLLAFVEAAKSRSRPVEIYPLSLFARGAEVKYVNSSFLANYLLTKSLPEAKGFIVGVPPLPRKYELAKDFARWIRTEIPEVRDVLTGATDVDIAFVGLGSVTPSRDMFDEFSKLGITYDYITKNGGIGGINHNYFDRSGNQIGQGIVTLEISQLKKMAKDPLKAIVLVAGGNHKREAIEVALKSKMVNSLVTDETTASYLLTRGGINAKTE